MRERGDVKADVQFVPTAPFRRVGRWPTVSLSRLSWETTRRCDGHLNSGRMKKKLKYRPHDTGHWLQSIVIVAEMKRESKINVH